MASFKIRCVLAGHSKDVRAVTPANFPEGAIVSGSRDITARVWVPDSNNSYSEAHCVSGHSNFVSAVCVTQPDDSYPHGLILTGSNDSTIKAYTLEKAEAIFTLTGHDNTVSTLAAGRFGTVLSGSWDTTARVWLKQKCVMTLRGHEAAVWAVGIVPENGFMITGSADKTIKLWKAGKCEKTLKGHEDCVRGIAILNSNEFLSCSNDATIRRWLIDGECAQIYYGHTNYIYSIAILPNGTDFVTTSEDRSLRVWQNGECKQVITHPAQSVWSVCCLQNGDVVTASSDGMIRIFTSSPDRAAGDEVLKAFEEEVAASAIPSKIGDVNTDELPGPAALFEPGTSDGQTKMIRDGTKIECHQWNSSESRWVKIGDVVGGSGGSQQSSGKILYEGKEYDFVFDVDIEEGKPPLKLPYNATDDPWHAAQNFIHRYNLSQMFLDQIANFVIENAKGVTIGQAPQTQYADPFTGGGRYVPGTAPPRPSGGGDPFTGQGRHIPGTGTPSGTQIGGADRGADPFTGASSYTSGSASQKPQLNKYFPIDSYIYFDSANENSIIGKFKEFNSNLEANLQVNEEFVNQLPKIMKGECASNEVFAKLASLLDWPLDCLFPILDVIRLAIRKRPANDYFCGGERGLEFLQRLFDLVAGNDLPANQIMALRIITNAFSQLCGEELLTKNQDSVISKCNDARESPNKNVQTALCSVLLNYSVHLRKSPEDEPRSQCLIAAGTLLTAQTDPEAQFRLLVCLGNLATVDDTSKAIAESIELRGTLQSIQNRATVEKVQECAKFLSSAIAS